MRLPNNVTVADFNLYMQLVHGNVFQRGPQRMGDNTKGRKSVPCACQGPMPPARGWSFVAL